MEHARALNEQPTEGRNGRGFIGMLAPEGLVNGLSVSKNVRPGALANRARCFMREPIHCLEGRGR